MIRSIGFAGDQSGPIVVSASFQSSNVARIVLTFADRRRVDVPFVWVQRPINAGFFYVAIPAAQRRLGHRPSAVLFFDARGLLLKRALLNVS
jgi:hypothetical protein